MPKSAIVVGGTGPSGVPIVENLLEAGFAVTVFHSGRHEVDFSAPVEHIHADARQDEAINEVVAGREWDVAICTSGRLRSLALAFAGKVQRLVGITGQPVYAGTMARTPLGVPALPIPEFAPRQRDAQDYTGKVAVGEDQLFEQHGRGDFEAVVVRYPGVYGPRGPLSHEWAIVKRVLAGRRRMAMPHDGLTYFQRGYVENLARLVFLAATRPEASGQAFNSGDERVLSARAVAQVICDELGAEMEFIGVPAELCRGSYPLADKSGLILDMSKARTLLGYRDVVDVEEATRLTARWLADNPDFGPEVAPNFGGTLDFDAEDALLDRWLDAYNRVNTSS